jgi:hypothetical protein
MPNQPYTQASVRPPARPEQRRRKKSKFLPILLGAVVLLAATAVGVVVFKDAFWDGNGEEPVDMVTHDPEPQPGPEIDPKTGTKKPSEIDPKAGTKTPSGGDVQAVEIDKVGNGNALVSNPPSSSPPVSPGAGHLNQPTEATTKTAAPPPSSTPPAVKKSAVFPENPRLVVYVVGDPMVANSVESYLLDLLDQEGYAVSDRDLLPSLEDYVGRRGIDLKGMGQAIGNQGDVLVAVDIQDAGSRELQYSGRSSTLYASSVSFKTYFPAGKRKLGRDLVRKLEYTTLNADRNSEALVLDVIDPLLETLRNSKNR